MITILDRMFLVTYLRSYLIVCTCLIGLYAVLDLFTHLDDFVNRPGGFAKVIGHIVTYYGYRVPQVFDLMADFLTLAAAVFSVSWMQRNNELLPQLSAGIPTRRAIRPILIGVVGTLCLTPLNQEFVIPEVADQLMTQRDDPEGARAQVLMGAYDSKTGVHIEGLSGFKRELRVERMNVAFPADSPGGFVHMQCESAVYVPKSDDPLSGGWDLSLTDPATFDGPLPSYLTAKGRGRFFLKVEDADYEAVCRGGTWYIYSSTTRLREMLIDPEPRRRGKMAVLFHTRLTRPLVGAIMVVIGISIILGNPNRQIIISAGLCMAVAAALFLFTLACKYLGDQDFLPAPLAAWFPVIVFGPVAIVYFDSVHT